MQRIFRNVVPWAVAVVALAWVLHKVKWADLFEAFRQVPLAPFLFWSLVLLVINCAADCVAMYYTFGWFHCRIPYRELFIVRAATYLLAVVQYYVGQAAIAGFLYQRKGVPPLRAGGFILFISGINMAVLVLLASVGFATGSAKLWWLHYVPIAVAGGALLYGLVLWQRPPALIAIRLFSPLFEMGVIGHLKATAVRVPHVLVIIIWHFMALRMFGLPLSPFQALMYLPAVFFIAALPISVQGLGMSQGAAVFFFADPHDPSSQAKVIAYSLAMTGVSLLVQLTMGFAFLPAAKRLGISKEAPHYVPDNLNETAA